MSLFLERAHVCNSIPPVADFIAGDVFSDVHDMKDFTRGVFLVIKGVGTTGVMTITVEACDDVVPTNVTAVPFWYKLVTSGDTEGALTKATASGFSITAGSNGYATVEVLSEDLGSTGYRYVRLGLNETTDDPIVGCVAFMGIDSKRAGASHESIID